MAVAHATIELASNRSIKVDCQFNPATFEMTKTFTWRRLESTGRDASRMFFKGGQAADLSIPLLFDSTADGADVRGKYTNLMKIASVDTTTVKPKSGKGEPSMCIFTWGSFLSFNAVISEVHEKFLLFKPDGTPLRAEVTVKFKEIATATAAQNPTSRSEARKTHVVCDGDTLDYIAYKEYGDAAQWRYIAETNDLADPKTLRAGQVLRLPPLP